MLRYALHPAAAAVFFNLISAKEILHACLRPQLEEDQTFTAVVQLEVLLSMLACQWPCHSTSLPRMAQTLSQNSLASRSRGLSLDRSLLEPSLH